MMVQYTVSYAEFKEAQRVFMMRPTVRAIWVLFWNVIFPALGILCAIFVALLLVFRRNNDDAILGIPCMVAYFGLHIAIRRRMKLYRQFKLMQSGRASNEQVLLLLQEGQLVSRVPGLREARYYPAAIHGIIVGKHVVLILVSKSNFLIVPREALGELGLQELNSWWSGGWTVTC